MSEFSYKDGRYQPPATPARPRVSKEFNASTTSQPLDPTAAANLSAALEVLGCDVTGINQALATGTPTEQTDSFLAVLNKLLWPAGSSPASPAPAPAAPKPLPGHPVKQASNNHSGLKASQGPYANLTRGWFNP